MNIDRPAAVWAGIAASVVSTVAQMALWWLFADGLPEILFRDARLAAAIVMGREVLPPPSTFDGAVMLVATVVHFALSIAYGMILSALVSPLPIGRALLAGAVFGLVLYGVNMYGFTFVFPWFDAARDWITVVAHVVFGVTGAGCYKALARPIHVRPS